MILTYLNFQTEQEAKEAEMESFIIGLGEVKGWLESTEYQLANISHLDPDEQDSFIKVRLTAWNYNTICFPNRQKTGTFMMNANINTIADSKEI